MVISFNKCLYDKNENKIQALTEQILYYRKPSKLWQEFNHQFAMLQITSNNNAVNIEKITYSRYAVGYNFAIENEARIITHKNNQFIGFNETDILAIIVPDTQSKMYILNILKSNWHKLPELIIYPQ